MITTPRQDELLNLLAAWDRQQTGYLPHRERRFDAMLDVLEAVVGSTPLALDFACGPGSISQRLLERLPQARAIAVDLDPVLLALGEGARGTMDGRLTWMQDDLRSPDWSAPLGVGRFDAALSSTAVHWLTADELATVYGQIATILRPGGIVLIADNMTFEPEHRTLRQAVSILERERRDQAFGTEGVPDWERWWQDAIGRSELAALVGERERLLRPSPQTERDRAAASAGPPLLGGSGPAFAEHRAALAAAGFDEIEVVWQDLDDRVLAGVRSG